MRQNRPPDTNPADAQFSKEDPEDATSQANSSDCQPTRLRFPKIPRPTTGETKDSCTVVQNGGPNQLKGIGGRG